jgi:hypothetical protein
MLFSHSPQLLDQFPQLAVATLSVASRLNRIPEADRRAVDPPIEVEAASWSYGGQLDWWMKERQTQDAVRRSSVISMGVLRSSAQQRHVTAERPADRAGVPKDRSRCSW